MNTETDLKVRLADIHWPDGYVPEKAELFAHNDIYIEALPELVFETLIDAKAWPTWYPNSTNVRILTGEDVLGPGCRFTWSTFGLEVYSVVEEFEPQSRIGWYGRAPGIEAYHTWLLVPRGIGTLVVGEEIVNGPGGRQLREANPGGMHSAHALWNERLRDLCEAKR